MRMGSKQRLGRTVHAVAALLGAVTSGYLLKVHADVAAGAAAGGLCNLGAELNCSGASSSAYATLFGVPIAALGLGFYVGALAVSALSSRDAEGGQGGVALLVALYTASVAYSLFLLGVSVAVLGSVCPACAVLYVVNGVGLASTAAWSGRSVFAALRSLTNTPGAWMAAYGVPFAVCFAASVAGASLVGASAPPPSDPTPLLSDEDRALLRAPHAPGKGPADAPVVIVEFSDFECPYCSRLAENMDEAIVGFEDRVRLEFRHFPLDFHPHAADAAKAAVCANQQGAFWPYHDALFAHQRELGPDAWSRLAREAGVDPDALQACLDAGDADTILDADQAAGAALGVRGTPAFFVNGEMHVGALPPEDIRALIESALPAE